MRLAVRGLIWLVLAGLVLDLVPGIRSADRDVPHMIAAGLAGLVALELVRRDSPRAWLAATICAAILWAVWAMGHRAGSEAALALLATLAAGLTLARSIRRNEPGTNESD